MPRRHATLERQSSQSPLSIQQWAFCTIPPQNKKTSALRFVFNIHKSLKSTVMNTKPLRFRFGSGAVYYSAPVFLIFPALGIDGVLR
jgi:hypothetical protein